MSLFLIVRSDLKNYIKQNKMNEFLKTRQQITESTEWLIANGYVTHPISCKDWELANVTKELSDGDLLDMGADGSFILHNAIKKGIKGRKVGIDLAEVTGTNKAIGADYYQGDLMKTDFTDNYFDTIVSLSVIEHQINFYDFAKECGRLLRKDGKLFVSFDYWNPKPETSLMKLYSLDWNILDNNDVIKLIFALDKEGLYISKVVDWSTKDAVINPTYCSPAQVSYTFGILEFIKK